MTELKKSLRDNPAFRWGMLLLLSLTMATNYYFYDALSPLKDLLTKYLDFSSSDYGFFVSAYSIPNVFLAMAVIGGIILDKIGIRITGFMFVSFMVIGSSLTAYGATDYYNNGGFGYAFMNSFLASYSPALKMMSLGFFFFGLGAETSCVVVTKAVVKWFKGKELALALGLNIAIARLGTAMALVVSPLLVQPEWTRPIWFGALLLCIGLTAFVFYMIFDSRLDKQIKDDSKESPEDQFRFSDLGKLLTNPSYIFIALLCVTFYSAVFPFIKYAPDLMINKFGLSREIAGTITSILPFGTLFFTPLFGWIADNRGKSASLMIYGSLLLIVVHLLFSLTTITPYIPMFILGVAFSLVPAAMWPSVSKIVEENKLGTAYGLMFSIQNIGLWLFPMLIGYVLDQSNGFATASVNADQFASIKKNNFNYTGVYLNNDSLVIPAKNLKVNFTVHADSANGPVVWDEIHHSVTNEKGEYNFNIGNGNELLEADFGRLNLKSDKYFIEVLDSVGQVVSGDVLFFKSGFNYSNTFKNTAGNVAANALVKIKIQIHAGSKEGNIVWNEDFKTATDAQGIYSVELGTGSINVASVDKNELKSAVYKIKIKETDVDSAAFMVDEVIRLNDSSKYSYTFKSVEGDVKKKNRGIEVLLVNAANNDTIWQETQDVYVDETDKFSFYLGEGLLMKANCDYINWNKGDLYAEVHTPLDYTNPVVMLAGLGLLGLLFAFLLKRADKTSGYGLELPNKQPKKEEKPVLN